MSRVTNVFLPGSQRDSRDVPTGVQGMTNFYAKQGVAEVDTRYQSVQTAFPYSDYNMRFDSDKYTNNPNHFGMRSAIDPSPGVQTYAPAGMLGQIHAGKATGDELSTLLVRKQFNPNL